MSNFFQQAATDADALEEKLLGPDYPYYKYINTPAEMGMSSEGSMSVLADDVAGLINYVQIMVAGTGPASATGKPLGNKFFLKTGASCTTSSGKKVDRYTYFNNVPDGSIPMLSSSSGISFSEFEGLIPGIMSNIGQMNPLQLFSGFMEGSAPPCTEITMETIDTKNNKGSGKQYVANAEIKGMPPCWFSSGSNPITGVACRQTFVGSRSPNLGYSAKILKKDPFANMYIFGLSLALLFLFYKYLNKK